MPHEVLIWDGEKPKTGIQEKAREARYALLLAHARSVGADVIMTAHHADDQAETILFRLLRGSGLTGLAGMKRETIRDGIAIARPLLDLPKAELVAICRDAGQAFVDDPSNSDSRYARTEMRAVLAALSAYGLDTAGLTRLARRLARADEALALAARAAFASALAKDGAMLDLRALADGPEEIFLRVLTLFLENSGARTPLKLERLEALGAKLRTAVAEGESLAATLAGLQLKLDLRGKLCAAGESPRRRGERPAG
jgi:tRNA(Ile)-lysidine synthase